jgi:4-alpha-glucanotransferase
MRRKNRSGESILTRRGSGILLHISSLPSRFGIGDLGAGARRFADFLAESGMSYWQILPMTPVHQCHEYSPYNCVSAFAGNTYLISPEAMVHEGYLRNRDLTNVPGFSKSKVAYRRAFRFKDRLFDTAYDRFSRMKAKKKAFSQFCKRNAFWLSDFAAFVTLKKHMGDAVWSQWPDPLKRRDKKAVRVFEKKYRNKVEREKFLQFVFYEQWKALRKYCSERRIRLIGDLPIYVDLDSADVWSNPSCFELDKDLRPRFVSGVPPDYFSDSGQLWGNPVYDWALLKRTGYRWWVQRVALNLALYDYVRLDHFRGLIAYWQISCRAKTAKRGKWVSAPAYDFLNTLKHRFKRLPLIAEDLGTITPEVNEVVRTFGLPGMKVLLFAFGEGGAANPYLLHNHTKNCVVYTGTHDNNTVRGWFECEASEIEKQRLFVYIGKRPHSRRVHEEFIRLAMMSVANTVIIPMQDILGLGESARMNRPASIKGNWRWRLSPRYLTSSLAKRLRAMNTTYGRA